MLMPKLCTPKGFRSTTAVCLLWLLVWQKEMMGLCGCRHLMEFAGMMAINSKPTALIRRTTTHLSVISLLRSGESSAIRIVESLRLLSCITSMSLVLNPVSGLIPATMDSKSKITTSLFSILITPVDVLPS